MNSLTKYKYDYIIINDGSTNNTLKILEENNLNYINLQNNVGIRATIQNGYKYAKNNNYDDIVVQYDGDGQHDAKYIEKIIEPIKNKKVYRRKRLGKRKQLRKFNNDIGLTSLY